MSMQGVDNPEQAPSTGTVMVVITTSVFTVADSYAAGRNLGAS